MADSNSYPMISEKNWWTIREKFKASLPAIATPNYVKTLLTLSSDSSANSNVITPMRRVPSRFMRKFICRLRLSEVSRQ